MSYFHFDFSEPPEKPLIYDQRGKVTSNGIAGPYEENSDVKFICRVYGGKKEFFRHEKKKERKRSP